MKIYTHFRDWYFLMNFSSKFDSRNPFFRRGFAWLYLVSCLKEILFLYFIFFIFDTPIIVIGSHNIWFSVFFVIFVFCIFLIFDISRKFWGMKSIETYCIFSSSKPVFHIAISKDHFFLWPYLKSPKKDSMQK